VTAAGGATRFRVKAHPKSSRSRVERREDGSYEVWVREAPDKGRANEAVMEALAGFLGLPRSRVKLRSGAASRHKVIELRS